MKHKFKNQEEIVRSLLEMRWYSNWDLVNMSIGSPTKIISNLRDEGYNIAHKTIKGKKWYDPRTKSWRKSNAHQEFKIINKQLP